MMNPNSRRARIEAFVKSLARVKRANTVAPLVEREIASLRQDYAPGTLPATFSLYRKAIRTAFPGHAAADLFMSAPAAEAAGVKSAHQYGFTVDEIKQRKRETRYRVAKQQHSQIAIENPVDLLDRARSLCERPGLFAAGPNTGKANWYALIVGLALLTGRRPAEIASCGSLRPIKGETHWAMFGGQTKTRDAEGTAQKPYPIPLLAPASFVLKAWKLLRRHIPAQITTPEAYAKANGASGCFKVMCQHFPPGMKLYDLRAIYATLTWSRYAEAGCSAPAWVATVLGHS